MMTLEYYDHTWGGFRRFDSFGDSAYPAQVADIREARKVAAQYLNRNPIQSARVRILNDEGRTVAVVNNRLKNGKYVETRA